MAAHTAAGKMLGFSEDEILTIREGSIADPKLYALTHLTKEILGSKGYPSDEAINDFFAAGYSKAAMVELLGFVVLNVFTNYLNHIAETPIDFPAAAKLTEKVAA